jgi:hypothetical protein
VKYEFLKRFAPITFMLALVLGQPATAFAYVGPGAGLSIIGSLLAFFAAIVIGIFGFLWFPIRRLLRKRKQAAEQVAADTQDGTDGSADSPDADEVNQGKSDA